MIVRYLLSLFCRAKFLHIFNYLWTQYMKIFFNHFPYNILFHLMITMNEEISHTCDLPPWRFGMAVSKFEG